jgi:hypothetical protein|tara:strand:+ start:337 stop:555 length:219 start_codon:yes stop_codon:yes gene_type:complete
MDDTDPSSDEVLQLTLEILQLIESKVSLISDDEMNEVLMSNESIQFFLEQDNPERALLEARNLKKYLIRLGE